MGDSISPHFSDGDSLQYWIDAIGNGEDGTPDQWGNLPVVDYNGAYWTLGNRRLFVLKRTWDLYGTNMAWDGRITCEVKPRTHQFDRHLTTECEGRKIRVVPVPEEGE